MPVHIPCKTSKGLTLLELVIAMAVWLGLLLSVLFLMHHTSATTSVTLARQNALENARITMDALVVNIELASRVTLVTGPDNMLQSLTLRQQNSMGMPHYYVFDFNVNAPYGSARHQVVRLGNNEFSSNIGAVYITYVPNRRVDISVVTACETPLVLHGSVDAMFKNVRVH